MTQIKAKVLHDLQNLFTPDAEVMPTRRFDLDWLRVLAFALLILYHCGMFYVANWGFHIKSSYQSALLENIMLIVEPWRMPILWLISGISIKFVLAKVSLVRFISMRSFRLLLPLLFGVLVVVPPQLYIEMTYNNDLNMNYWQFMQAFFSSDSNLFTKYQAGIWPHIDVNHLWFIRSLWQYSLAIVLLLPILNMKWLIKGMRWLFHQHAVVVILIAVIPVFIIQISWDGESSRYPIGFTFMLYGYLIGWEASFWQRLVNKLSLLLIISTAFFALLICFYNVVWLDSLQGQQVPKIYLLVGELVYSLTRVLGILCALSFAYKYLNKNSKWLGYLNEAVYPFYILHQTIIIVAGYYLSLQQLGPIIEPLLLITITVIGCLVGFELIRRSELLRPFFGLKMQNTYRQPIIRLGYASALIIMTPLAFALIN